MTLNASYILDLYIDATLRTGDQAYDCEFTLALQRPFVYEANAHACNTGILAFWEHSSGFRKKSRDFIVETGAKSGKKRAAQAILHGGGESMSVQPCKEH